MLSLFEWFKRVNPLRSEDDASRAIAAMEQGSVVDLDRASALQAAQWLPATLWTQDSDFDGLLAIKYFFKR